MSWLPWVIMPLALLGYVLVIGVRNWKIGLEGLAMMMIMLVALFALLLITPALVLMKRVKR